MLEVPCRSTVEDIFEGLAATARAAAAAARIRSRRQTNERADEETLFAAAGLYPGEESSGEEPGEPPAGEDVGADADPDVAQDLPTAFEASRRAPRSWCGRKSWMPRTWRPEIELTEATPTQRAEEHSAAGAGEGGEATVPPPPAPVECRQCAEKGPCVFLKNGCVRGVACEFCHDRSHTKRRPTRWQRERDCRRCAEKGPCGSIRGRCASGAACEFCHNHAHAVGRPSEYQRVTLRWRSMSQQRALTGRPVALSGQGADTADLPGAPGRGAHTTVLAPSRCGCVEWGAPCRTAAELSRARYRSDSPRCYDCTVFCSCRCREREDGGGGGSDRGGGPARGGSGGSGGARRSGGGENLNHRLTRLQARRERRQRRRSSLGAGGGRGSAATPEASAQDLHGTEDFSSSSPPPALTSSSSSPPPGLGVEVAQVPARLAWLESEMRREQSRMDEYSAELVLLEQELPKQYARIAELIAFREQLDLWFPEAAVADPAPAPAVADPDPASERSASNRASQSKQNSGGLAAAPTQRPIHR